MNPRWLEVAGAHNVRDLAGLPAGSAVVREGVLLRGDHLDALTGSGIETIRDELGLATIVDLRSAFEDPRPPAWAVDAGLTWHHLPLVDLSGMTGDAGAGSAEDRYAAMTREAGPALAALVSLLGPEQGPALLHCAAGKDRTGVAVAVLLDAAGVDRAAIVEDFLATEERLPRIRESLARQPIYQAMQRTPEPGTRSTPMSPAPLHAVFDVLDAGPGGSRGFLVRQGAAADAVEDWRRRAVGPPGR